MNVEDAIVYLKKYVKSYVSCVKPTHARCSRTWFSTFSPTLTPRWDTMLLEL